MAVGDFFRQDIIGGGTVDVSGTETGAVEIHTIQGSSPANIYREFGSQIEYDPFAFKGIAKEEIQFLDDNQVYSYEQVYGLEHMKHRLRIPYDRSDSKSRFTSPTGVEVSSDGKHIYVVGSSRDRVRQYDMDTPNDLTTAHFPRFDTRNLDSPSGIAFNDDGTKMYLTGTSRDEIRQYSLSVPYEFGNAEIEEALETEDGSPVDVVFNDDGTKMFELGSGDDRLYEYDLSTAYDISTAVYGGLNADLSAKTTSPGGVAWSDDGTKFFVTGNDEDPDHVHEFNLSTAYSAATATPGSTFDLDGTTPKGLAFNDDGTKMFVASDGKNDVEEYTLSTAFDITSASFVDDRSAFGNSPAGIAFNDDGTKLMQVDRQYDYVRQLNMETAYDVTTAERANEYDLPENSPQDIRFKPDGTRFFTVDSSSDRTRQYDLSTPFRIETASNSSTLSSKFGSPEGIAFSDDGTKMFELDNSQDTIVVYEFSTPWDISTEQRVDDYKIRTDDNDGLRDSNDRPSSLLFNDDGTVLYVIDNRQSTMAMYKMNEPYEMATLSHFARSPRNFLPGREPEGFAFGSDGTTYYEVDKERDDIIQYGPGNYRAIIDRFNQSFHTQRNKIEVIDGENEIHIESEGAVEVTGIEVPN